MIQTTAFGEVVQAKKQGKCELPEQDRKDTMKLGYFTRHFERLGEWANSPPIAVARISHVINRLLVGRGSTVGSCGSALAQAG
jgi:hypothetical protein